MYNLLRQDKSFIIGEAGVNHNGDINLAKKLIDVAVEAGVDAIKFQTFNADEIVTKDAPLAQYQKDKIEGDIQYHMLKKLELSIEEHMILQQYCLNKKIIFLSTPFDFKSVDILENMDIPFYKISSGDLTNIPLIKKIAKLNKFIILSTGMGDLGEIELAVNKIRECHDNIILLQCTSNYPTKAIDVNLRAMLTLKEAFGAEVGYSDHTEGIEVSIAAIAMGAKVIEKHFTIDKKMEGPDHRFSLTPEQLKNMVGAIRNVEMAMGSKIKRCSNSEIENKNVSRKSIVANRNITIGETINEDIIGFKRPENGLSPKYVNLIIGKKAIKNICKDETITSDKVQ